MKKSSSKENIYAVVQFLTTVGHGLLETYTTIKSVYDLF